MFAHTSSLVVYPVSCGRKWTKWSGLFC